MPMLTAQQLRNVVYEILVAAGATVETADTVAVHLADANLTGHDSHGLIRIPDYVQRIEEGRVDPQAEPTIAYERKAVARVDGHGVFGQVGAKFATETAIRLAREYGIGMVTMCNIAHSGRFGTYPEMAARQGMAAIMFGGNQLDNDYGVAPYGGTKGRLGTNPFSMAFPHSGGRVILLDFATSETAVGKVRVYQARSQSLPGEWLLDSDGRPSSNPEDYFNDGTILPLGGLSTGHKGFALSLFMFLLGRTLGQDSPISFEGQGRSVGDSTIIVIDVSRLRDGDGLARDVETVIDYTKETPLMSGFDEILYPGEKEARTRQERQANGVEVEDATWARVRATIDRLDIADKLPGIPG